MSTPLITLKSDRVASVAFHHPWLFSGAIEKLPPNLEHGSLVQVADPNGKILGTGTYSKKSSIAVRVFEFGAAELDFDWFIRRITQAHEKRLLLGYGPGTETTGYRVVFGESDGLPGLVVDRYEDVLVLQSSTAGMDALKPVVTEALQKIFNPASIIERSDIGVRREEGLKDEVGVLSGESVTQVEFSENGHRFIADVMNGQKTGFYLDQKDLRSALQPLAKGREVLHLFPYTGATNIYLLKGGAKSIHAVDSSAEALEKCKKAKVTTEVADAFQWLDAHQEPDYDMMILDPPALIRSQKDADDGKKAYHFLNRSALRLLKDGGLFATSSCSHFFELQDFLFMLRRASVQAGVTLDILKVIHQSPDHPLSLYFPESAYLKTVVGVIHR